MRRYRLLCDIQTLHPKLIFIEQITEFSHSGGVNPIVRVHSLLAKPFMPAVFFLSGVTYDTFTLTRIDRQIGRASCRERVCQYV